MRFILFTILMSFAFADIQTDIQECYNWNPALWNYIIKNQSQDNVIKDIYTMCNARGSKSIKPEYHKAKNTKKLNEYELKLYNIMKAQVK